MWCITTVGTKFVQASILCSVITSNDAKKQESLEYLFAVPKNDDQNGI